MKLAPVVIFVYNRPSHTRRTLEALEENRLAKETVIYVFCDGCPDGADEGLKANIREVRRLVREKWNFNQLHISEKDQNWGLADSIKDGVSKIVEQHGKVIVLEDDIVTSPGFLEYMQNALNIYETDGKVMHISGYVLPIKEGLPPTYFYNTGSCWGWATWSRAWRYFNDDAEDLLRQIESNNLVCQFNVENSYPFIDHLKANISGELKTWAIKWYASFFLEGGYALHPYPSLVNNIGHDGGGQNCGVSQHYEWNKLADSIQVDRIKIVEHIGARELVGDFYESIGIPPYDINRKKKKRTLAGKIRDRVKKLCKNSFIKKRIQF